MDCRVLSLSSRGGESHSCMSVVTLGSVSAIARRRPSLPFQQRLFTATGPPNLHCRLQGERAGELSPLACAHPAGAYLFGRPALSASATRYPVSSRPHFRLGIEFIRRQLQHPDFWPALQE